MKRVVILGSTGSIGENALRVVDALPERLRVTGLAVQSDYRRMLEQAQAVGVEHVAVADEAAAERCRAEAPAGIMVHGGAGGVAELAALPDADVVLCAVVGMAGLLPVLAALGEGHDVALATKEVLVSAGGLVTQAAQRSGARLLPVDSEHSAIFQCLQGSAEGHSDVRRIVLTASGGPFASRPAADFERVTIAEALDHPRWQMGRKVTIDSATLMNKGLEIMEAHWLFGVPLSQVDVVIHRESIVHSLVEFVDGSLLAQMGPPDMRFAIQYALTFPERLDGGLPRLDLAEAGALHFEAPDAARFPCLGLAREAGQRGGTFPAVMNAANEVAVERFLAGKIPFPGIWNTVQRVLAEHDGTDNPDLQAVVEADAWARRVAGSPAT